MLTVIQKNGVEGGVFSITQNAITLGRYTLSPLSIQHNYLKFSPWHQSHRTQGSDIWIKNDTVSRQHCTIVSQENGDFFIKNLSNNGTTVNTSVLSDQGSTLVLQDNDIICISGYRFRFNQLKDLYSKKQTMASAVKLYLHIYLHLPFTSFGEAGGGPYISPTHQPISSSSTSPLCIIYILKI